MIDTDNRISDAWLSASSEISTPLGEAKNVIISALSQFDTALGQRADKILNNHKRMNVYQDAATNKNMMMCRPAGLTQAEVEASDMHINDFAKKFSPNYKTQSNENSFAIIDFDYDGTQKSIVNLAHELGHAIADDIQRENGKTFRDFSWDEQEQQAYFVQSVLSHYTGLESSESIGLINRQAGKVYDISDRRLDQYKSANTAFLNALKSQDRSLTVLSFLAETHKTIADRLPSTKEGLNF